MTTELTHVQAAVLRAARDDDGLAADLELIDGSGDVLITAKGEELLAAYDAKYRIVEAEALSAIVEFAEGELAATDETFAGYPARLAEYDWLREAIAKIKEAIK